MANSDTPRTDTIDNKRLAELAEKMKKTGTREDRLWFIQALVGSSLILPVLIIPEPVNNTIPEDATVNFLSMKTSGGLEYLVTFTSMEEMNKWNKNPNKMYLVRRYDSIKRIVMNEKESYDGFVIDPCGCNVAVKKNFIEGVERVNDLTMIIRPERIETKNNMGLTVVKNPPKPLIKALTDYMSQRECIRAAYIMQTIRKGEEKATPIIIVDFCSQGEGLKEEFDKVAAAAHTVIKKGDTIGLMPAFDKVAKKSIQGVEPFYKK